MRRNRPSSRARIQGSKRFSKYSPPARSLTSDRARVSLLSTSLAVLTFGIYSRVIGHSFLVLDDREYVTANPHIQGLHWSTVKWALTSMEAANWHPLTWLSHALDYQLFRLNPVGHHLDSILIHLVNAILLFLGLRWLTKRLWPSFLVAALFAVHPINVESVAWIAERKNVLSTLFFLLALGAYAWYAQRPGIRRYLLVVGAFVGGLMAKPMLVTLPFLLLLLDYWPLERMRLGEPQSNTAASGPREPTLGRLLLEKVPFLLLSAASCWITLKAQHAAVRNLQEFSRSTRIENATVAYGQYLWKAMWPARLALYPYFITTVPPWQWIFSGLVLISATVVVILFPKKRYVPIGWLWFLGTLIPVIGLVQVGEYSMADRYAYIPLIGIFIVLAYGLADLAGKYDVGMAWRVVPTVCALAVLSCLTWRQSGYWESDYGLWSHTLSIAESPYAHNATGIALMNPASALSERDLEEFASDRERFDEARRHFERALELHRLLPNPDASPWDQARNLTNLANLERMQNRLDEAREHDQNAVSIYRRLASGNPDVYLPYLAAALNNLGAVARLQNQLDEARRDFEQATEITQRLAKSDPDQYLPNLGLMLNEFAMLDGAQNKSEAAREHYDQSLQISLELAQRSPNTYNPQLAMTLSNFRSP